MSLKTKVQWVVVTILAGFLGSLVSIINFLVGPWGSKNFFNFEKQSAQIGIGFSIDTVAIPSFLATALLFPFFVSFLARQNQKSKYWFKACGWGILFGCAAHFLMWCFYFMLIAWPKAGLVQGAVFVFAPPLFYISFTLVYLPHILWWGSLFGIFGAFVANRLICNSPELEA